MYLNNARMKISLPRHRISFWSQRISLVMSVLEEEGHTVICLVIGKVSKKERQKGEKD